MPNLEFNQQRHQVAAVLHEGQPAVRVDGVDIIVRALRDGEFAVHAATGGPTERIRAVAHGDTIYAQIGARGFRINSVDAARGSATAAVASHGAALAPMPGVVVSVLVTTGQDVRRGDALLVIESMKLQTTMSAAFDGTVGALPVAPGQTFQRGTVLATVLATVHAAVHAAVLDAVPDTTDRRAEDKPA